MMLKSQFCVRSSDHRSKFLTNYSLNCYYPNYCKFSSSLCNFPKKCRKFPLISCNNRSHGEFNPKSFDFQPSDEYIEASLLISETVKHHHLRKQGFQEEVNKLAGLAVPFSAQVKYLRNNVNSIGLSILRRFRHPTIFLKISCEGDFLLPIVVEEFAVENLINSLNKDGNEDLPNQFKLVNNLVDGLGNEVRMVKITERTANTYLARLYFGKVEERGYFSVDARPSDAINVAQRCEAPIYVNKQIVLTDAIRISYGTGRVRDTKPIYDVLLDSPMDGPDLLVEEFNLVKNMNLAVKEERYNDAVMWRDKLVKHCNSEIQKSQPKNWHEISIPELP